MSPSAWLNIGPLGPADRSVELIVGREIHHSRNQAARVLGYVREARGATSTSSRRIGHEVATSA